MADAPAAPRTNRLGLAPADYRGLKSTLCAGCGHNAISERIVDAMYEMGVRPERVARLRSVAHVHGLPLDARSVTDEILGLEGR